MGWKEYAYSKKEKIFKYREEIAPSDYYLFNITSAMAFPQLNQYINNKYFNYEIVKKMRNE